MICHDTTYCVIYIYNMYIIIPVQLVFQDVSVMAYRANHQSYLALLPAITVTHSIVIDNNDDGYTALAHSK
jgi:hypothetical protein